MLFQDILMTETAITPSQLQPIIHNCSQFLSEAGNLPLFKNLSAVYPDVHRVKVRMQRRKDCMSEPYDLAFGTEFSHIRERAVFAQSTYITASVDQQPYYIFPINGYKFLYSKEVLNSSVAYKSVVELLTEMESDKDEVTKMLADVLRYTYSTTNIQEGIGAGAEVVIYNIPHFYAVRLDAVKGYSKLLDMLTRKI